LIFEAIARGALTPKRPAHHPTAVSSSCNLEPTKGVILIPFCFSMHAWMVDIYLYSVIYICYGSGVGCCVVSL